MEKSRFFLAKLKIYYYNGIINETEYGSRGAFKMIEKLYTVEEVAEMASVTGRTIRNYLKSGKLVGRKIGGQWRFPESEVQRLLTGESNEEYVPQNIPTATNINTPPQSFNTGIPPQQEQHYTPNTYSQQADPSSFGGSPYYSQAPENIPTQNPMGAYENSPQTAYSPQPYATSSFPAQKPYAQPIQQNNLQNEYADSINVGHSPTVPNTLQQPSYSQPQQSPVSSNYSNVSQQPSPTSQNSYMSPAPSYQSQSQPQATQNYESYEPYDPYEPLTPQSSNNQFSQNNSYDPYEPYDLLDYDFTSHAPIDPPYEPSAQDTPLRQTSNTYSAPDASVPEISDLLDAYVEKVSSSTASGDYRSASQTSKEPTDVLQDTVSPASEDSSIEDSDALAFSDLSDVGKQVGHFLGEVHDCSNGPQICAVVDLYQSLEAAKVTSEHLTEMAEVESENGIPCECFVEYDSRYYVARYTLFGSSYYLAQCLDLIG